MSASGVVTVPAVVSPWTQTALVSILGLSLLAGVMATGCAFVHRWATTWAIPVGAAILLGITLPSIVLTMDVLLRGQFIDPAPAVGEASALYIVGVVTGGVVVSFGGRYAGDHLGCSTFDISRIDTGGEVTTLIQSAGVAIALTLPTELADVDGYPPVAVERKRTIAGRTLLFPRHLSRSDLEKRLRTRLEEDFDLGRVTVAVDDDGSIDAFAVGGRRAGLSPTIPPSMEAVAVVTDCTPAVSTGDPIELWAGADDGVRLVSTGIVHAADTDVVTVVPESGVASMIDDTATYRLTTAADTSTDVHELIGLTRVAAERVVKRTVEPGAAIDGEFVTWVSDTVLLIERDGECLPFPDGRETITAGDTVHTFVPAAERRGASSVIGSGRDP
ncbi:hypothetical protein ACLI4Q_16600 [Natrialbaceae archaeon A-CW1-1]